jgi:hypothetical protein
MYAEETKKQDWRIAKPASNDLKAKRSSAAWRS